MYIINFNLIILSLQWVFSMISSIVYTDFKILGAFPIWGPQVKVIA